MQKHLPIVLLLVLLIPLVVYPTISPTLGIITLLLSLAFSTYAIYTKHAGIKHARPKILKETGVMVLTLLITIFLSGLASMLTNFYVRESFGAVVGLVSALCVSLVIGYAVKKGMGRLDWQIDPAEAGK